MPLKIVVIGAGIAGLVAAISLRQAGHTVLVLEKSALATEVGAALQVQPNGGRVLARLGFSMARARACRTHAYDMLLGADLSKVSSIPLDHTPGHPEPGTNSVHRVDLHRELLRLATAEDGAAVDGAVEDGAAGPLWGPPVELRLAAPVRCVSADGTGVVLESGEEVGGDLIVAADGLHSVVRRYVVPELAKPVHSGLAAFRFLLETDKVREDEELAPLLETVKGESKLLVDMSEGGEKRNMIWYHCQDGELQNFVGFHASSSTVVEDASEDLKKAMMAEFSLFDPRIRKMISLSSNIKRWPLFYHDPLPTWVRGRYVLIGDAAHPMLPFGAQGASIGMEDGGALGALLTDHGGQDAADLDSVLASFYALRRNRCARVQILSSVRAGREGQAAEKLGPYLDEKAPKAPTSFPERVMHDWSYDVYAACEEQKLRA